MTADEYLKKILEAQTLDDDGPELKALRERRQQVEELLRKEFPNCEPRIRYAGSYSKGTMNRESYDLDITCYFQADDSQCGDSLEDIFNNVDTALKKRFTTRRKNSAIRLMALDKGIHGEDFHIDVVPGRFTDSAETDVFLHRDDGDKDRLKTNLDVHVKHVKESGVIDAIRLLKLWRDRHGVTIKTFVLELLVIDLLKSKKSASLSRQLSFVWEQLRDKAETLAVEDPANPHGNDLDEIFKAEVRRQLAQVSKDTLKLVDDGRWTDVFGDPEEGKNSDKGGRVAAAVSARSATPVLKPWAREAR